MRTQKQIEASRRNGAASRGPITPEGKETSALNRRTHGLAGNIPVLASEADEAYDELLNEYLRLYNPANIAEHNLVIRIVSAQWRLDRCLSMETVAIDHQMALRLKWNKGDAALDEPTRTMLAFGDISGAGGVLTALHRYETRLERTIRQSTADLRKAQTERRAAARQQALAAAAVRPPVFPFEPKLAQLLSRQPYPQPSASPTPPKPPPGESGGEAA